MARAVASRWLAWPFKTSQAEDYARRSCGVAYWVARALAGQRQATAARAVRESSGGTRNIRSRTAARMTPDASSPAQRMVYRIGHGARVYDAHS